MLDRDQRKRGVADELGSPRVLRHWNTDKVSGVLKDPELVVYELEMEYLRETDTLELGLIEPSEAVTRPRRPTPP